MAFEDEIIRHGEQIKVRLPHIKGEEAAKQALVVPLLQALGYDVWDPREVQPEYIADFAKKKSNGQMEKVDYAIHIGGSPVIFIECKSADKELDDHDGQLARYFNATPSVRVAILTNGVRLKIFTDLLQQNIMDSKPWLDVELRELKPAEIDALKRLRKSDFAADQVVSLAEEMVYYNAIMSYVATQLGDPSESFVRFVAGEISTIGRVTAKVVERLTPIMKVAIRGAIIQHFTRSLDRQPDPPGSPTGAPPAAPHAVTTLHAVTAPHAVTTLHAVTAPHVVTGVHAVTTSHAAAIIGESREGVVTTAEELECFSIISKMIKEVTPDATVAYRDSKSYFTIIQKNVRKWFIRLGVERHPYWIALRHVRVEEARHLCPGLDVAEGGQYGDSRFTLKAISDLPKLRSAILASYNAEFARVVEDAETSDPSLADTHTEIRLRH